MVQVNIRELTHNFSHYLKNVKEGERIIIMERNKPVADLIPHNENVTRPGWKREITRLRLKGKPLSQTLIEMRREDK
jgi:prevent-host-death family protein